jgi:hypothetical protein
VSVTCFDIDCQEILGLKPVDWSSACRQQDAHAQDD